MRPGARLPVRIRKCGQEGKEKVMQIKITGKNIDTGEALKTHVENNIAASISKYFERSAETNVVFSKQGHLFRADCTIHLDSGLIIKAGGENDDIYSSFDAALLKAEKQLRRYKRRLKNHHVQGGKRVAQLSATARVIAPEPENEELPEEWLPITIAEDSISVPELTVSEAVMQMEISHESFLIFKNSSHGQLNIVHRRPDGNIGWIDPEGNAQEGPGR